MADEITPNLGLTKPDVGGSDDMWGEKLNNNFDIIDASITPGGVSQVYVDTQDALRVLKAGDTMTGDLKIQKDIPRLLLNKTGLSGPVVVGQNNGLDRWTVVLANGTVEPGSGNAGSNFSVNRHNDLGNFMDSPLAIDRSSGRITVLFDPVVALGVATKGYTDTIVATKESIITAGTTAQYWRGDKTFQTLDKVAVGLGNVDNTSDANKPISAATQTALNLKAPLASPVFTGNPTAPTPSPGDNDTSIATTAFVTNAVTAAGGVVPSNTNPIMDGVAAPGVSDLYSRGDHVHPSDTSRVAKAGDTMTGALTLPAANPTVAAHAAHKGYVDGQDGILNTAITGKVSKTGDTMSGPLVAPVLGHVIGGLGSTFHTGGVLPADASIRLYDAGANNWAGIGSDQGGNIWFRTGTSGNPVPGLAIDTSQFVRIDKTPTQAFHAARKDYVDTADALKVNKAGDVMSGSITFTHAGPFLTFNDTGTSVCGIMTQRSGNTRWRYDLQGASGDDDIAIHRYNGVTFLGTALTIDHATGLMTIAGDPTVALGPATKQYVDNRNSKGFYAHKNGTAQSGITPATFTKLTATTERSDLGGYYDAANSRFTPPAGAVFLCAALVATSNFTIGQVCAVDIFKNGARIFQASNVAPSSGVQQVGAFVGGFDACNGTDYYEWFCWVQAASGTVTVDGGTDVCFFTGTWLG
jgi:hypothetical protein